MSKNKYPIIVILITLFLWLLILFIIPNEKEYVFNGSTMGTTYEVKIIGNIPSYNINDIQVEIDSILLSINQSLSTYITDSDISYINNDQIVYKSFNINEDFKYVLDKSIFYYNLTGGAFDVTIKPLMEVWGFRGSVPTELPSSDKVQDVLKFIGVDKIKLNGSQLTKGHPKLQFDFGAIAKGYAVDIISDHLISKGYEVHYVEIGGEIKCKGKDWLIQIAYPEFMSNKGFNILRLNNYSIATSGTYNQYLKIEDFEYSHILDPRIGKPVKNNIISVSVISLNCIDVDALATSLKVLGKDEGLKIINSIDNTECMFIVKENNELKEFKSKNFSNFIVN